MEKLNEIAEAFANMTGAVMDGKAVGCPHAIIMCQNPRNMATVLCNMQPKLWGDRGLLALLDLPEAPLTSQEQFEIIITAAPYRLAALNKEAARWHAKQRADGAAA
jgi:hypothetical protein